MKRDAHARWWLGALMACMAATAMATSVPPKPLEEMVREADHVVVATIVAVDMVDGADRPVKNRAARTGPGLDNRMWLNLAVRDVIHTRSASLPASVRIPLWSMWHYELGTMQDSLTGTQGIFLLKGDAYEPVYPAGFQRALEERATIEALLDP